MGKKEEAEWEGNTHEAWKGLCVFVCACVCACSVGGAIGRLGREDIWVWPGKANKLAMAMERMDGAT